MKKSLFNLHGNEPYRVVVVHGGPGSSGEMGSVADEISTSTGVLEPIQSALSVDGQVQELRGIIEENGSPPVTLIGFSWGAWLSSILAARYPHLVKKLILVSSGPFEQKYVPGMTQTRLERLNDKEAAEDQRLSQILNDPLTADKDAVFTRLVELSLKSDCYKAIDNKGPKVTGYFTIYSSVWPEAAEMRRSGELLDIVKTIQCPVLAIHGDYDPHPAEGVQKPLSAILKDFRFVLLPQCGHYPWLEVNARSAFSTLLHNEI